MDPTPKSESAGTYTPDNLIAGDFPLVTVQVTIASGAGAQPRGAVLGKVTATGKYIRSLSAASDGSETPRAILAQDVDATSGDVVATAYIKGEFNERALTIGTGHTADSIRDALADKGIILRKSVAK